MQKKSNPQFNTPPKSQNISHGGSSSSKQKPRHENRPNPFQIIQSQSSQSKQKYIERQNDGKQIEVEVEQRKVTQCISFDLESQRSQQGRWRGIHSQSMNGIGPNQRSDISEFSGINSRVVGQGLGPQTSQQTVKKPTNLPPKPQLYQSRQHERSQKRHQCYTQPINLSQKSKSFSVKSQIGGSRLISNPQRITSQSFQSFKTPANHQPPIQEWSSPKQNIHHRIQELEELNDQISEMNEQQKIDMVKKSEKYVEQSIPKASWFDDVPEGEFAGITHYPQNQSNQYPQRTLFDRKDTGCFREESQISYSLESEQKQDEVSESLQNYQPHSNQTFITDYLSEESRQRLQQRRTNPPALFSLSNQLLQSQKSSIKHQVPKQRQKKRENSQTSENELKSYKVVIKDSVQKNRDGRDSFYKNNDIYGLYEHTSSEKSQEVLNEPLKGDFQQNQSQQIQKQQQNQHPNTAESRENFSQVETSENVNISGGQRFSTSEYAAETSEQFQIPTGDSRVAAKFKFSQVHPSDEHEFQIPTGDIISMLSHNSRNYPQSSDQEFQIPTGDLRRVIVQSTEPTEGQLPLNVSNARTGRVTDQSMIQSNRLESPNQRLLQSINQTQSQRAPKREVDRQKIQPQTELRDRAENSERKFINEGIIRRSSIINDEVQPQAPPVHLQDIVEPERINLPPIIVVSHEKKQHLPIPTATKQNRKRVHIKTLQNSKRKQEDRKVGQKLQDPVGSTYHFELVAERDRKKKALIQVRRSGRIYSKSKSKFEEELSAYDYVKEKQEGSVQQLQKESLEKEEQKIQEVPTHKKAKTSQSKSKKSKKSISKPKPNQSKKSRQSIQSFDDEPITVEWLRQHVSELNEIIIDKAFFYDDYKAMTEKDAQISKFLLELQEKASNSPTRMKKAGQQQERENDNVVIKKDEQRRREQIQEKGSSEIVENYSRIQDNVFIKPIQISQKKSTMKREIERKHPQTAKSKKEKLSRLEISRSKNKIQRTLELSVGKQSKSKQQVEQKAPQFEFAPYAQERPVHIPDQDTQEKQEENLTEEGKREIFQREKKKYRVPDEFPLTIEAVMDPDILNLGIYALVRLGRLSEFQLGTRYAITPLCEIKYARKKHVLMVLKESKKLVPPEYSENIALVALNSMLVELIEKANCRENYEGEIRMEKQQNKKKEKNQQQREKRNEDKMQVTNHFQDSTENLNEENTSQMRKKTEQDKKNETKKKELNEQKDQQGSRMRFFR